MTGRLVASDTPTRNCCSSILTGTATASVTLSHKVGKSHVPSSSHLSLTIVVDIGNELFTKENRYVITNKTHGM